MLYQFPSWRFESTRVPHFAPGDSKNPGPPQVRSLPRSSIKAIRETFSRSTTPDECQQFQLCEAMHGQKDGAKAMTLITRVDGDRLLLEVTDTGMGVDSEHLPKMFSHGFTAKASGPGFGSHSRANAAT
jgi:hypothetical protein